MRLFEDPVFFRTAVNTVVFLLVAVNLKMVIALGLSGFFTIAIMLSLLIFIGEAVRDAFDPRKTYA